MVICTWQKEWLRKYFTVSDEDHWSNAIVASVTFRDKSLHVALGLDHVALQSLIVKALAEAQQPWLPRFSLGDNWLACANRRAKKLFKAQAFSLSPMQQIAKRIGSVTLKSGFPHLRHI